MGPTQTGGYMFRNSAFVLLLCITASITACGGTTEEDPGVLVDQVLELSGLNLQMDQYPDLIQQSMMQYQGQMDPERFLSLSQLIAEGHDPELLKASLRQYFIDNYDQESLQAIKSQMELPLGVKMAGLEAQAMTPEALAGIQEYVQELQTNKPPESRMTLIENLDVATKGTDNSVNMIMGLMRSTTEVFGTELFPEQLARETFLDSAITALRPQVEPSVMFSGRLFLLYTYRSTTDEELGEYLESWGTEAGQWYTGVASGAVLAAVTDANERVSAKLTEVVKQEG
jgi:hypothetical protein